MLASLLDILLPRHCPVSGRPLLAEESGPVAPEVLRAVHISGADYCSRCGAPQGEGVGVVGECTSCRDDRTGFGTREIVAIGNYSEPLRSMCKAMKFGGARKIALPLAAWLAQLLLDRGVSQKVNAIVPMPLHVLRRYERGYNQAALIARELSRLLGTPVLDKVLSRRRGTERQARLSALERRKNVEAAFVPSKHSATALDGKVLLLVDDVMTTGATIAAAARSLKKAGAKSVYAAVAARATLGDDS